MSPAKAIIHPSEGDGDEQDDKSSSSSRGSRRRKPHNRKSQTDARTDSPSHPLVRGTPGHGSDLALTDTPAPAAASSSPAAPSSAIGGRAPSNESYPTTATTTTTSRPNPNKVFQFVDANPSTDAQRFQNKVLVRSNASNYHWRRARKSTHPHSDVDVVSKVGQVTASHASPATKRPSTSTTPISGWLSNLSHVAHITADQEQQDDFNSSDHALLLLNPRRNSHNPLSLSLFGSHVSGHYDPFGTYPSDLPKEFVSPVLDQCKSSVASTLPSPLSPLYSIPSHFTLPTAHPSQ